MAAAPSLEHNLNTLYGMLKGVALRVWLDFLYTPDDRIVRELVVHGVKGDVIDHSETITRLDGSISASIGQFAQGLAWSLLSASHPEFARTRTMGTIIIDVAAQTFKVVAINSRGEVVEFNAEAAATTGVH